MPSKNIGVNGGITIKRIVSTALLAIFCWYMGSVTLFPHVHIVDGVVICHSHPYSGSSDNPGHTHSVLQLETIAHLSLIFLVLTVLLGGISILDGESHRYGIGPQSKPVSREIPAGHLRGPPVSSNIF
ncbi:MAG: hypothetical protein LIO77_00195 [Rikenellaceae bacterium]|nr:hypothetical protein [Rikenellaceae bacterium]